MSKPETPGPAISQEQRARAALLVFDDGSRYRAYIEYLSRNLAFVTTVQTPATLPAAGHLEFSEAVMGFQVPFDVAGVVQLLSKDGSEGGVTKLEMEVSGITADRPGAVEALLATFPAQPPADFRPKPEPKPESRAAARRRAEAATRRIPVGTILKGAALVALVVATWLWIVPVFQGSVHRDRLWAQAIDMQKRAWRLEDEAQSGMPAFAGVQRYREAAQAYTKSADLYQLVIDSYQDPEVLREVDPYLMQVRSGARRCDEIYRNAAAEGQIPSEAPAADAAPGGP